MTPRYRLVIFDWDGTLMDSAARIVSSVQAAIAASGLPPRSAERIRSIIGLGVREGVAALYPDVPQTAWERLAQGYREAFNLSREETPIALFGGAEAALARLEGSGCLLAVATGKSRAGLRQELCETGLAPRFVALRTVDDCPSKPHPAMVEELMQHCGTGRDETLVVGDTLFDLEMAANAGVNSLGVSWGAHPVERLRQARPLGVLQDFEELDRWVVADAARV